VVHRNGDWRSLRVSGSIKVAGRWIYLYRPIDQFGQVIDVENVPSAAELRRRPCDD